MSKKQALICVAVVLAVFLVAGAILYFNYQKDQNAKREAIQATVVPSDDTVIADKEINGFLTACASFGYNQQKITGDNATQILSQTDDKTVFTKRSDAFKKCKPYLSEDSNIQNEDDSDDFEKGYYATLSPENIQISECRKINRSEDNIICSVLWDEKQLFHKSYGIDAAKTTVITKPITFIYSVQADIQLTQTGGAYKIKGITGEVVDTYPYILCYDAQFQKYAESRMKGTTASTKEGPYDDNGNNIEDTIMPNKKYNEWQAAIPEADKKITAWLLERNLKKTGDKYMECDREFMWVSGSEVMLLDGDTRTYFNTLYDGWYEPMATTSTKAWNPCTGEMRY
jgi:hypothetical protein